MFFKPGEDIPLYGQPKGAVDFGDGTFLTSTRGSLKIVGMDSNIPLVRLDFNAEHGKPANHLQFGQKEYTERFGEEAKDIFSHILLKKVGVDIGEGK